MFFKVIFDTDVTGNIFLLIFKILLILESAFIFIRFLYVVLFFGFGILGAIVQLFTLGKGQLKDKMNCFSGQTDGVKSVKATSAPKNYYTDPPIDPSF